MPSSTIFILTIITSAFSVYATLGDSSGWKISFPVIFIFIITQGCFLKYALRPDKLRAAAEQVYFLGYLCTICSVCVILYRFGKNELTFIIASQGLAVKLLTTIAGLIGNTMLRAKAANQFVGPDAEIKATVEAQLIKESSETAGELGKFRRECQNTSSAMASLSSKVNDLNLKIELAKKDIEKLGTEYKIAKSALEDFLNTFGSIKIDEQSIKKIEEAIRYLSELPEATKTATTSVMTLGNSASNASGSVTELGKNSKEGGKEIKSLAIDITELKKVLDDFVKLTKTKLENDNLG